MPRKQPGPPCAVCGKPSVARKLCQAHYKRWQRHGSTEQTRPEDWGSREKHSLYQAWNWTSRTVHRRSHDWDDFWRFVDDVGEKPSNRHTLRRLDVGQPFGPSNFYWKETAPSSDRAAYARRWRAENPVRAKNSDLKNMHGITIYEYDALLESQNSLCAICSQAETITNKNGKRRALAIDHCHKSREIRGLLCTNCNKGLGHFMDSVDLLRLAIRYLNQKAG